MKYEFYPDVESSKYDFVVNEEKWFTMGSLMRILGCKKSCIYNGINNGKIDTMRVDEVKLYRLNGYM